MQFAEELCTPKVPSECWLDYLKNNFHYNPCTGLLYRKNRPKPIGSKNSEGYLVTRLGPLKNILEKRNFKVHIICFYLYWEIWPTGELDHENSVRSDNRIENLMVVSRQQNLAKRRFKNKIISQETDPF